MSADDDDNKKEKTVKLHRLHNIDIAKGLALILCTDDEGVDHNVEVPLPAPLKGILNDAHVAEFCHDAVVEKRIDESTARLVQLYADRDAYDTQSRERATMDKVIPKEEAAHVDLVMRLKPDAASRAAAESTARLDALKRR